MSSIDTMSRWPRQIKSMNELPARYVQALQYETKKKELEGMYCVLSPLLEILWYIRGGQLLCIEGDKLHFFKPKPGGMAYYPINKSDMNFFCMKNTLLSSELTFNICHNGSAVQLKTEYNSVREDLYDPFKQFLRGTFREKSEIFRERSEKYLYLKNTNFKLMNLSTRAYDCASTVCHFYQPPVRLKKRWYTRKLADGILYMLTENEFIILQDIEYGAVYYYMPKDKIQDLRLESGDELWYLRIIMQDAALSFPFPEENYGRIKDITDAVKNTAEKKAAAFMH